MRKSNLSNIFILVVSLFMCLYSFGVCSTPESTFNTYCYSNFIENIFTFLGESFVLFVLFSFYIWFIPGLVIAINSFNEDFKEIKSKKLSFKNLFKKTSFYGILFLILSVVALIFSFFSTYAHIIANQ